jgi:hypothetical protein
MSMKFAPPNHFRRLRTTCGRMASRRSHAALAAVGNGKEHNTRMRGPWSDWWTWKSLESEVRDFEGSLAEARRTTLQGKVYQTNVIASKKFWQWSHLQTDELLDA